MDKLNYSNTFFINSTTAAVATGTLVSLACAMAYFSRKQEAIFPPKKEVIEALTPSSCWSTLLPCLTKYVNKLFFLILAPYYFLFGEKELWMNAAPNPIHYNVLNTGALAHLTQKARVNMQNLLKDLGAKEFTHSLANNTLPGWSPIDPLALPPDKKFFCGSFYLTGEEIKNLASSLKVSYDPLVVSSLTLHSILKFGASSPREQAQARGRMVSSLALSLYDSKGNPLPREKDLPVYRVYTCNAPNLAYNSYDKKQFLENGTLDKAKYTKELERIFLHYFKEAAANQDKVVVLPGFGLGAFMQPQYLPEARQCFAMALDLAIKIQGSHFDKIIFADPNTQLTQALRLIPNLILSNKSCLDIAHYGAQKGYSVAVFNPGDGNGIPGQFWLNGHIALEEMFGLFTTLLLGQHPHCNPKVTKMASYTPA